MNSRRRVPVFVYDRIAGCYDALAQVYSLGGIGRSKAVQVAWASPNDRMLVAGVGSGQEVPRLLERGVELSCVDASHRMLERLSRRLEKISPEVRGHAHLVCDDVMAIEPRGAYDLVSANYFLNLYARAQMEEVLGHLVLHLRSGGRLLIADFAPYHGFSPSDWLRRLYYGLPEMVAFSCRLAQWHTLYDYRRYLVRSGLVLESEVFLPLARRLPLGFVSIVARRL